MLAILVAGRAETHAQDFLRKHPKRMPPVRGRAMGVSTEEEGDESTFDWGSLVPHLVYPAKVAIIEALLWVAEPLSPSELVKLLDDREDHYLSIVAYHVRGLVKAGALEVRRTRQVRGAQETYYFFPPR